jgi:hypothetical protein
MTLIHAAEESVTYSMTSSNDRKGVASGVICGSALKGLGDKTI